MSFMTSFTFKYGNVLARFVHFFSYPREISIEEGEEWYFSKHVPEVKKLPGIVRYRSWRGLPPIKMWTYDPYDRFVRMSEIVFQNLEFCLNATIFNPKLWLVNQDKSPGFNEFECVVLDEEPQYNLLKDIPVQQYQYTALRAKFIGGPPEYYEEDDTFMDVYIFNYKVPVVDGEDWYLGHHIREGRISKQLGNKHYKTWKTLKVPEDSSSTLKPNRFYRITELGLPQYARTGPKPGNPPKARLAYTRSPLGEVINEWRNILIDPNEVQDLLV